MAVLQKMEESLLEKALFLWVFGRWKLSGFRGGCGVRTGTSTFVLQHNERFYLLPLKKEKNYPREDFDRQPRAAVEN